VLWGASEAARRHESLLRLHLPARGGVVVETGARG